MFFQSEYTGTLYVGGTETSLPTGVGPVGAKQPRTMVFADVKVFAKARHGVHVSHIHFEGQVGGVRHFLEQLPLRPVLGSPEFDSCWMIEALFRLPFPASYAGVEILVEDFDGAYSIVALRVTESCRSRGWLRPNHGRPGTGVLGAPDCFVPAYVKVVAEFSHVCDVTHKQVLRHVFPMEAIGPPDLALVGANIEVVLEDRHWSHLQVGAVSGVRRPGGRHVLPLPASVLHEAVQACRIHHARPAGSHVDLSPELGQRHNLRAWLLG